MTDGTHFDVTRHDNGAHGFRVRSRFGLSLLSGALVLVAGLTTAVTTQTASHASTATSNETAQYQGTTADVPNPDRGFYTLFHSPVSVAEMEGAGTTVIHDEFNLKAFTSSPLSAAYLAQVSQDFANARTAGVTIVPRFAYDLTSAGQDAPLPLVLSQIRQLSPILHANADVISFVDAGFIGAWGEWHASSNHLINDFETDWGHEVNSSTRAIYAALLQAVPSSRMITVRTDRYAWQLLNTMAPVTASTAYNGSARSRTGIDNDCFLADGNDIGTYAPGLRSFEEAWLSADTTYVVQNGETCASNDPAAPYIACPQALNELRAGHWSVMGAGGGVYTYWQQQGCLTEVEQDLGYRFRLVNAQIPQNLSPGQPLNLKLNIANDGFTTPFNQRPVDVVLRNAATGQTVQVPVNTDPRKWAAGQTTAVDAQALVPAQLAPGTYQVLLNLPDAAASLAGNPAYSIQFANTGTWEAGTGYNNLNLNVVVS